MWPSVHSCLKSTRFFILFIGIAAQFLQREQFFPLSTLSSGRKRFGFYGLFQGRFAPECPRLIERLPKLITEWDRHPLYQ